jgi:hypothetical protein
MKIKAMLLCAAAAPLMVSCALQPIALAPVGPNPFRAGASSVDRGDLVVYSETEEYFEDDMFYFPHTDYQIYSTDGRLLKRVWNHQNHEDESPATVSLPPGHYIVKAWAEFYGLTSVPVVIKANRTTKLILQPGWNPGKTVAAAQTVRMPNGYPVGWRAELPAKDADLPAAK